MVDQWLKLWIGGPRYKRGPCLEQALAPTMESLASMMLSTLSPIAG
jgi:hypothetical protein